MPQCSAYRSWSDTRTLTEMQVQIHEPGTCALSVCGHCKSRGFASVEIMMLACGRWNANTGSARLGCGLWCQ
jgi:hypothetical protein